MKEFKLKPQHITLLKNAHVSENEIEFGAPSIDPKYPYGDSQVIQSMIQLLLPEPEWPNFEEGEISEDLAEEMYQLHRELQTALKIALKFSDQPLRKGLYVKEGYTDPWEYKGVDPQTGEQQVDATEEIQEDLPAEPEETIRDPSGNNGEPDEPQEPVFGDWSVMAAMDIKEGEEHLYQIETEEGKTHTGYFGDEGFRNEIGMWILAGEETMKEKIKRLRTVNHETDSSN